jgi:hypothetical protein
MLGTIHKAATSGQAPSQVPIIVKGKHGHGLTEDKPIAGHLDIVLKGLAELTKLFMVTLGVRAHALSERFAQIH